MKYKDIAGPEKGRGCAPQTFLDELVAWAKTAPDDIFDVNDEPGDVMGRLCEILGPWDGKPGTPARLLHRKCAMLELLTTLAGFESSWNWKEGVDRTNKTSMARIEGQETGIFQVSYNSLWLEKKNKVLRGVLDRAGVKDIKTFIDRMKTDHVLALEYAARLLRINFQWDGPIKRREIDSSLSRTAVEEFKSLLG